jgi:hypothetical protein
LIVIQEELAAIRERFENGEMRAFGSDQEKFLKVRLESQRAGMCAHFDAGFFDFLVTYQPSYHYIV